LVVGLDGTGDTSTFTNQSFKTLLSRLGIQIPPGTNPSSKSIAAVAIHAELPAFAKPGQHIDVTVSAIGGAKSLRGGTLLLSQLKGVDGNLYAIAQGNLVVGGFGIEGKDGSQIKLNVPVVGRIAGGAIIEVASPTVLDGTTAVTFLLHRPDFTTAKKLSDAVNEYFGPGTARPVDPASVSVSVPMDAVEKMRFLSVVENIQLEPGDAPAKIVVNSRTGTIVIGNHVAVSSAAVAHGSLTVTISERTEVSQPMIGTQGRTVETPKSDISVSQPNSRMFLFPSGVALEEIVRAVNEIGAAPGDLMAILEALKQVGALRAELEVI
jgi:flagellar P-ring protein precursor FlgI